MASKKDLVEGQSFSRRRLITAFVSGAPGGREVEPGKPLRAVVGGVILSVVLVVGALAVGLLAPTLPDGWDQNSLVIAEDTGARYVALNGTLYPVINTASARLLIPSGFKVVSADADKLTGADRGPTLGIIGAPDALPSPAALVDRWSACTSRNGGTATTLSANPDATAVNDQGVVVSVQQGAEEVSYLIDNGFRYQIPAKSVDAVRRLLQLDSALDYTVSAVWLNLFLPGPALGAFAPPGAGTSLSNVQGLPPNAQVGSILTVEDNPDRPYLLLKDGAITPFTPFAEAMYRVDSTVASRPEISVPTLGTGVANADPVWPSAWPSKIPAASDQTPCALLKTGRNGTEPSVALGMTDADPPQDGATTKQVAPGAGALIRSTGRASTDIGPVFLVDQTGTAFPVQGSGDQDPISQLGYAATDIEPVPQAWLSLLTVGPVLSPAAAYKAVSSATGR